MSDEHEHSHEHEGILVTLSNVCAFCGTNYGERGMIVLSYCIAYQDGKPCNKAFCPNCSTEEMRRAIRCPEHYQPEIMLSREMLEDTNFTKRLEDAMRGNVARAVATGTLR